MLPELTASQYSLVYNLFSFTFAAMFGSFIFFVLSRQNLAPRYRGAMVMSALVVAIAGYHYLRIFQSWADAYTIIDGIAQPTGVLFNDAYRYVDWALTVPLLVAELVAVLGIANKRESGWLTFRLATAALLMVVLGYPGEVAETLGARALWGTLSTIPFLYIVYVLFAEMGNTIQQQSGEIKVLLRNTRLLLLFTWGFYPIVYMLPFFGIEGAAAITAIQVGYCVADVAAKCGYGFVIYNIARLKSEELPEEEWAPSPAMASAD